MRDLAIKRAHLAASSLSLPFGALLTATGEQQAAEEDEYEFEEEEEEEEEITTSWTPGTIGQQIFFFFFVFLFSRSLESQCSSSIASQQEMLACLPENSVGVVIGSKVVGV